MMLLHAETCNPAQGSGLSVQTFSPLDIPQTIPLDTFLCQFVFLPADCHSPWTACESANMTTAQAQPGGAPGRIKKFGGFTIPFLSLVLPIFFFCPSLPFLPEQSHSVSRPEVVGSDRTWVQFAFFCYLYSLVQIYFGVLLYLVWFILCVFLQCFDTVGWVI